MDMLRGIVVAIMVLVHVRDFFHSAAHLSAPTDAARTWPLLYMTRWVTTFCAYIRASVRRFDLSA
jgi:uncharacterized membrane protein